jgi:hypothetical protein
MSRIRRQLTLGRPYMRQPLPGTYVRTLSCPAIGPNNVRRPICLALFDAGRRGSISRRRPATAAAQMIAPCQEYAEQSRKLYLLRRPRRAKNNLTNSFLTRLALGAAPCWRVICDDIQSDHFQTDGIQRDHVHDHITSRSLLIPSRKGYKLPLVEREALWLREQKSGARGLQPRSAI